MATRSSSRYEPAPRTRHSPLLVDGNLYLWGGWMDGLPQVHDSPEKREFLSSVDVFQSDCGDWIRRETSGTPPLGVERYCCAAVGDSLYYFGGYCGHDKCYHNSVHKLSTLSLQWMMLSPSMSESLAPMKKISSGMVAFRDGEEDILCVVAGYSTLTPSHRQPGALYIETARGATWCNEQHMFSLSTREWSSPRVTGHPPPPCSSFTLTPVGERRAALFGGSIGPNAVTDDLLIVELTKHTVHWTKINKPVNHSVEWPTQRRVHATTCVSGPLLVIVGGTRYYDKWYTISDCWIHDLTTMKWKKLPLPDTVTEREWHSLSAIQLSPHNVLLVAFGGRRSIYSDKLSDTVLIELFQGGDGQWMMGRVGAALEDKREYQQMLSEGRRRRVEGSSDQLHEQQLQLERARELEQRLMAELQQLMAELQQVTREKEQVTREKEQVTREKEQREQQLMRQDQELIRRESLGTSTLQTSAKPQTPVKGTKSETYSQAPSSADLMTLVAKKIPTKWYEVGVLLDIETPTLDSLETQTTGQVRLFMKVFNQWKQEGKVPYTWDTIISTLEKADDKNTATNIRKWLAKEQH